LNQDWQGVQGGDEAEAEEQAEEAVEEKGGKGQGEAEQVVGCEREETADV